MKQIKQWIALMLLCGLMTAIKADEGMWLPLLLQQNEAEMQAMGFRLTVEDIYSINKSCLKDAVVQFGSGCTGEIVSSKGLLLTNHHCGYGQIQKHSSLEHNYLKDGFWAKNQQEELPCEGLTVTRLVYMQDVTEEVLSGVDATMGEKQRKDAIDAHIAAITKKATEGSHYTAFIRGFYEGNKYYMFVNEVFKDVRLVGTPPESIGRFGGDTDNWMWPRHTGDFSVFRIYVGKDGKPATYNAENVPYKPLYHIPISIKGYETGDFTFVVGYPGRTQQFLTSQAVDLLVSQQNPVYVDLRTQRLDIMSKYMKADPKIQIQYASKAVGISNGWKKTIGQTNGLKRLQTVEKKKALEKQVAEWINADPIRKANYGTLLDEFAQVYEKYRPLQMEYIYLMEAAITPEIIDFAFNFIPLMKAETDDEVKTAIANIKQQAIPFYKDYNVEVDKELFVAMTGAYYQYNPSLPVFQEVKKKYKGNVAAFADAVFATSIVADPAKLEQFLNTYTLKNKKQLEKDWSYRLVKAYLAYNQNNIRTERAVCSAKLDSLYRVYVNVLMEMQPDKRMYPDANLTMRVAYGQVNGFVPKNGVEYAAYSTTAGILEKEAEGMYDYVVEPKLRTLIETQNYGRYANSKGELPVAFVATNHTTGGNSGSPVFNAKGELLGLNFDRNWEGTMSDIEYDPTVCRNITLDIRYCLFVIDKFAGASHLIEEMDLR